MRKRDCIVKLRVSEEEKMQWQLLAESQKVSLADLIRIQLGNAETVDRQPKKRRVGRKADPLLLANIGRVGSNLNQIARWANRFKDAAEASEIMLALVAIEKLLLSYAVPPRPIGEGDNAS